MTGSNQGGKVRGMDPHNPMIEKPAAPKLCKDCRHHRPMVTKLFIFKIPGPADLARCAATVDLVSGGPKSFCDVQRQYETTACGPSGKLWEPK